MVIANGVEPPTKRSAQAAAYAIEAAAVDGNDVIAVKDTATAAVARARAGAGPTFLECRTYRHAGHSRTDPGKYRPPEEVTSWLARDPLPAFEQRLLADRICDAVELQHLKSQIADEVQRAAQEAAAARWPTPPDYVATSMVRG